MRTIFARFVFAKKKTISLRLKQQKCRCVSVPMMSTRTRYWENSTRQGIGSSGAEEAAERAKELDPENVGVYELYADIRLGTKRWEEAIWYADRGLELDPESFKLPPFSRSSITRTRPNGRGRS